MSETNTTAATSMTVTSGGNHRRAYDGPWQGLPTTVIIGLPTRKHIGDITEPHPPHNTMARPPSDRAIAPIELTFRVYRKITARRLPRSPSV